MPTLNEADLLAVNRIQEIRGNTRDAAKKVYIRHLQKLANPDIENRAQLILEAIERQSDQEVVDAVMSRNEEAPVKKTRAKKQAKAPKEKTESLARTVPVREVQLYHDEGMPAHVYTSDIGGKSVVVWGERNRSTADKRFETVNLSEKRLNEARDYAVKVHLPLVVCVTVRVLGKVDQGYAVPLAVFDEFKHGKANGFALSNEARAAYKERGWDDCKFTEGKAASKVA